MGKQKIDYKKLFNNFLKVNVGIYLLLIGTICVLVTHYYLKNEITIAYNGKNIPVGIPSSYFDLFIILGSTLITVGLTIIIVEVLFKKWQEPEKKFLQKGFMKIFDKKQEMLDDYSYEELIEKYDNIKFIGTRHYELTMELCNNDRLIKTILSRNESDFQINLYFLSPTSDHTKLFEQDKGHDGKQSLKDKILDNTKKLFDLMNEEPRLKNAINVYTYDHIPIGNITMLDSNTAIINRYIYFMKSQDTFWYVLDKSAIKSQKLKAYYDRISKDKKCIESFDDLK